MLFQSPDKPIECKAVNTTAVLQTRNKDRAKHVARLLGGRGNCKDVTVISENIPQPGGIVHGVLRIEGYTFGDSLALLWDAIAPVKEAYLSTLSLNERNSEMIEKWLQDGARVTLSLSEFFVASDKAKIYQKNILPLESLGLRVILDRVHAKIFAFDSAKGHVVVESSANLRSRSCIEQFTMFNDESVYQFHKQWLEGIGNGRDRETG